MKLWTKWKGDRRVMIMYSSVKPSLTVTSPQQPSFFWLTVHNIDSCLNLSMTTTCRQWPLSSVSKEVIMERFSFIGQLVSATYWSIYQSNVGQCINKVQITLEECTIWLKFKGCKSSFIKSFVSHLYNYLLLWCDHVFLTKFNNIIDQHASNRQTTGRQNHQISSVFQMRPP